jgi:GTPase SAR1 family protein
MSTEHTWYRLYNKRLQFAYNARTNFYECLDADIKGLFQSNEKGNLNICVFGKSQVGKTTLILKLIGIKDEYVNKVAKTLRGKREVGKSATLIPTIYSISEDDCFYISEIKKENKKCEEEELSDILAAFRERSKHGAMSHLESLHIKLPRKYFEESFKQGTALNMIDLPGVESHDHTEWEAVRYIINKFVPVSNLTLLVDRADQINNFSKLEVPGIEDWRDNPEKFRVVLTRSVSNEVVSSAIKAMHTVTYEKYIGLFKSEFERNKIAVPDLNNIFPLEYGESYEMMAEEVKEKINPVLQSLYQKLYDQIEESKNEYNYLMTNVKMYRTVEKIIEKRDKEFTEKIQVLEKAIESNDKLINQIQSDIDKTEGRKKELKDDWNNFVYDFDELKLSSYYLSSLCAYNESSINNNYKNTKGLKEYLTKCRDSICRASEEYMNKLKALNSRLGINNEVLLICSRESSNMLSKLNAYVFEGYIRTSKWEEDVWDSKKCVEEMIEAVVKDLKGKTSIKFNVLKIEQDSLIKALERKLEAFRVDQLGVLKVKESDEKEKAEVERLKESFTTKMEQEKQKSKTFMNYLRSEFHKEYKRVLEKINDLKTEEEDIIHLTEYLYLVCDEMSKLEEYAL